MTWAYRNDPEWSSAQADYLDDCRGGEDPDDVFARRVCAAERMYFIECRYRGQVPSAGHLAIAKAAAPEAVRGMSSERRLAAARSAAGAGYAPGMAAGVVTPRATSAATYDSARQIQAWLGLAMRGWAEQGMEHNQGGRSPAGFDSLLPTPGSAGLGGARRGAAGQGRARHGAQGGVAAHTGVRVSGPRAGHGIAELGPAWLGWAQHAVARPGKAWKHNGRTAYTEVQVLRAHVAALHGMAMPGMAGLGAVRHGEAGTQLERPAVIGVRGLDARARLGGPWRGAVQHGPAWHRQVRPGTAGLGWAGQGVGYRAGGRQALRFEPSTSTQGVTWWCPARLGRARRGSEGPGVARHGWRATGRQRGSSPRRPRRTLRCATRPSCAQLGGARRGEAEQGVKSG